MQRRGIFACWLRWRYSRSSRKEQGEYMGSLLNTAVELRNINKRMKKNLGLVTAVDVVRVIRDLLYSLEKNEDDVLATRKRKTEYDDRRRSERKGWKDTEQAVDADVLVGGKAMEQVERRLKKTRLPDDKAESDEEMLPLGERMN